MNYAQQEADAAGMARQTWCRKVWKLADYEAKDLLKGNASEVVWERILKAKGEHCGWHVALPVLGAVIGQPVHAFFQQQMKEAAKAAAHAQEHDRLAQAAYRRLEDDAALARQARGQGSRARTMGASEAGPVSTERLNAKTGSGR